MNIHTNCTQNITFQWVIKNSLTGWKFEFGHSFCSLPYGTSVTFPKWVLHTVQSSASSFNIKYPLFSLRTSSSSSCLYLLPHLCVTSILPFIFPSVRCFRRQFLCQMWPIHLAFLLFIVCRIFLSSFTLCYTSSFLTQSVQLIFVSLSSTTLQNFPGIYLLS